MLGHFWSLLISVLLLWPIAASGQASIKTPAPRLPGGVLARCSAQAVCVDLEAGGPAVSGKSAEGDGVEGTSTGAGAGVRGIFSGEKGAGFHGLGPGVLGISRKGEGVFGMGTTNGVHGQSEAQDHSGVWGENTRGGFGVAGSSVRGEGVLGKGGTNGVHGQSSAREHSGVWGENTRNGFGVSGSSETGIGVLGITARSDNIDSPAESAEFHSVGVQGSGPVGVRGTGNIGVMGVSRGTGVHAYGATGVYIKTDTGNLVVGQSPKPLPPGIGQTPVPYENVFRVDKAGRGYFNGGTEHGGADVAEFIAASGTLAPGEVVEIDPDRPGQFRKAATPNSSFVAGVISAHPGVTLGAADAAGFARNSGPQLALVGRVLVKASAENGAIGPGDLLVASSTPGHAMRAPASPAPGTIVGKALGRLESGAGSIEVLVMLR